MDVILSSGKVGHYYNMARALQEAGHLKKFVTAIYFKNLQKKHLSTKLLLRLSKKRAYTRFCERINPELITSISYPELLKRSISLFLNTGFSNNLYNYLFDLASSKHIEDCDIFLVPETYGLFSAKRAKNIGAKVVLDSVSPHPNFYIRILKEEAARLNIDVKVTHEYYLKKMVKEYELADFILVASTFVYNTFIDEGIASQKLRLVPYGIDLAQFSPRPKNDRLFRILYVGALDIKKGVYYLLKAFKELNLKNSELLMVGQPTSHIKPILKEYTGCFKHLPIVPHRFIQNYYTNSSVFVLPSIVEGWGLVTAEAMACGIPVIVTENCGLVPRNGKDGFVVPIRDVEALKERIMYLYENEHRRREMGRAAAKYAKQFSLNQYRKGLVEALENVLSSRVC